MPRLDATEINELHARVCKALADPKRLLIINELRDGPRSVGDIADALETSQPNVSRHLALLRDRGIVTTQRAGSSVFYDLASPKILQAVDLLREFMADELGWRPGPRLRIAGAGDGAGAGGTGAADAGADGAGADGAGAADAGSVDPGAAGSGAVASKAVACGGRG